MQPYLEITPRRTALSPNTFCFKSRTLAFPARPKPTTTTPKGLSAIFCTQARKNLVLRIKPRASLNTPKRTVTSTYFEVELCSWARTRWECQLIFPSWNVLFHARFGWNCRLGRLTLNVTLCKYIKYISCTINPQISAWGAYFKFKRRRGVLVRGGTYLIFPKSWPDMIIFLIHQPRINTNISCLLT